MRSNAATDDHPGLSPEDCGNCGERGEAIAQQFDRAAPHYDDHAQVQRLAAQRLAERIESMLPPESCRRALELGCGTGLLTEKLIGPYAAAEWTLTDLSPRMVEQCRAKIEPLAPVGRVDWQVMDARQITAPGPFDMIASNLTFQWFDDLPAVASAAAQRLAPGGLLIFNTLGAESFGYWRQLDQQAAGPPTAPLLPTRAALTDDLTAAFQSLGDGFALEVTSEVLDEDHPSFRAFLRCLQTIGAGTPMRNEPVTVAQLKRLLHHARHRKSKGDREGVTLGYEVVTIALRRAAAITP
jgi:malonyl-CoA O-methyltransferase